MIPFIGEIRMFGGNFAPKDWMLCQGQALPIAENADLFKLIGTTYGGDGAQTFNLPDLQSRVPVHHGTHAGTTLAIGEAAGVETVTLTVHQIPPHRHPLMGAEGNGSQANPEQNVLASSAVVKPYGFDVPDQEMAMSAVTPVGGGKPHGNIQPYMTINFIISLTGIFPQ